MINEIKVFSYVIPLEESDPKDWADEGMGRASMQRGITIRRDLLEETKRHIVLHELVHYVAMLMDLEIGEKENEVSTIATAFLSILRENPELVEWLKESGEKKETA